MLRYALLGLLLASILCAEEARPYAWLDGYDIRDSVERRVAPPAGFQRVDCEPGSFPAWLRGLPLKAAAAPVHLFDGRLKANQHAHVAVLDIDVGDRDLQQCADAVIRLRAEYLRSRGDTAGISFHFTSGDEASFGRWVEGYRPKVQGNRVAWTKSAAKDASYRAFRSYLNTVFTYAGTRSLDKELKPVADPREIAAGDVFVQGGSPGHAVIVLEVAEAAGRRVFLLAQSYMPAQEVHILKNPSDAALSPWYDADFGETLATPEWTFAQGDLKRF